MKHSQYGRPSTLNSQLSTHFRRPRSRRAFAVFIIGPQLERLRGVERYTWEVYIGDYNAHPNTPVQVCCSEQQAQSTADELSRRYHIRRVLYNQTVARRPAVHVYELKPFTPPNPARKSDRIRIGDYVRFEDILCRVTAVTPDTVTLYVAHPPRELLDIRANVFLAYFEPKTVTIPRTPDLEILNR